jgi:hypothetical protein
MCGFSRVLVYVAFSFFTFFLFFLCFCVERIGRVVWGRGARFCWVVGEFMQVYEIKHYPCPCECCLSYLMLVVGGIWAGWRDVL